MWTLVIYSRKLQKFVATEFVVRKRTARILAKRWPFSKHFLVVPMPIKQASKWVEDSENDDQPLTAFAVNLVNFNVRQIASDIVPTRVGWWERKWEEEGVDDIQLVFLAI